MRAREPRRLQPWLRALGLVTIVLACAFARVLWSARVEWQAAQRALSSHDQDTAIVHFRRAAGWYAPLNPYVPRALDALARLSETSAAEGDSVRALLAERAIVSAIMSTRGLYTPHAERLARAREHVALLVRSERHESTTRATPTPGDPSLPLTLLALAGWLCWIGAAFVLLTRGLDRDSVLTARARPALLSLLLGLGAFALGLALA